MYAKSSDPMQRFDIAHNVLFADDVDRRRSGPFRLLRRVDGCRVTPLVTDLGLSAVRRGHAVRNPPQRFLGPGLRRLPKRPHGSPQNRPLRDDIPGVARVKLRDRDDDLIQGIGLAAGDRLQGRDDLRPDDDGIDAHVRHGGMSAAAH